MVVLGNFQCTGEVKAQVETVSSNLSFNSHSFTLQYPGTPVTLGTVGKESMTTSIKELAEQVNASPKLIRKYLVTECNAVMEQGKAYVVTDDQASMVASHFGPRTENSSNRNIPKRDMTQNQTSSVDQLELSMLREDKARLEERVKGLDAQIALYQEQIMDLKEQLKTSNESLRAANESLQSTSKALEASVKHKGFFSSLFGRKRLSEGK